MWALWPLSIAIALSGWCLPAQSAAEREAVGSSMLSQSEAMEFLPFFFSRIDTVGRFKQLFANEKDSSSDARFLRAYLAQLSASTKIPILTSSGSVLTFQLRSSEKAAAEKILLDISKADAGKFKVNDLWVELNPSAGLREILTAISKAVPDAPALPPESEANRSARYSPAFLGAFVEPAFASSGTSLAIAVAGDVIAYFMARNRDNGVIGSAVRAQFFGWGYVLYALANPQPSAPGPLADAKVIPKCPQTNDGTLEVTYQLIDHREINLKIQFYDLPNHKFTVPTKLTETTTDSAGVKTTKVGTMSEQWRETFPFIGRQASYQNAVEDASYRIAALKALKKMNSMCLHDPTGLAPTMQAINSEATASPPSGAPAHGSTQISQPAVN
jgi:hypothetical protein